MKDEFYVRLALDMARIALATTPITAPASGMQVGDVEWLDLSQSAGTAARARSEDERTILSATQRLAMACYLLGLYADRPADQARVRAAAVDEWIYAGFAARRLGVLPDAELKSLTIEMLR